MATTQNQSYNLTLDDAERQELIRVLEQCASDTKLEKRHTDSIQYRELVAGEESCLDTLLNKVRRLGQ